MKGVPFSCFHLQGASVVDEVLDEGVVHKLIQRHGDARGVERPSVQNEPHPPLRCHRSIPLFPQPHTQDPTPC